MTPRLSFLVAGGSPGDRGRFVQALERQSLPPAQVEVLTGRPGLPLGEAWNEAARAAGGSTLVFTRADFTPALDFGEAHLGLHRESSDVLGLGRVRRLSGRSGLAAYAAEHWPADREALFGEETVPLVAAAGSPLSLSRERFVEAGGFAEGLEWGPEIELALRLRSRGCRLERTATEVGTAPPYRSAAEVLREAERQGRASVTLYGHEPALLPHLELGTYGAAGGAARALRGRLLALRLPPAALAWAGAIVPGAGSRRLWYRFVLGYAHWRGVWDALPDPEARRRLQFPPLVLMYHSIGGPGERPGRYVIPAGRFAAQMRWLRRRGYRCFGSTSCWRRGAGSGSRRRRLWP